MQHQQPQAIPHQQIQQQQPIPQQQQHQIPTSVAPQTGMQPPHQIHQQQPQPHPQQILGQHPVGQNYAPHPNQFQQVPPQHMQHQQLMNGPQTVGPNSQLPHSHIMNQIPQQPHQQQQLQQLQQQQQQQQTINSTLGMINNPQSNIPVYQPR